jgi:ABC-type multidrug transport system fused ATPase/permease subunit
MSSQLISALRSLKMVKALSLEKSLVRTLQPSFEASSSNFFHQNMLGSGQWAITEVIAFTTISTMLFVGLTILRISKAELFIILLLLFRALPQVRSAIDNYHHSYGFVPSMEIVRKHITRASQAGNPRKGVQTPEKWTRIEFQKVSFAYEDGRPIMDDFSFGLRRGEFLAVVGPSGSGKTTLLDVLLGLLQPQTGAVTIDGASLKDIDPASWHGQVSYLGQEAYVFTGTLRDNLVWGSDREFKDSELLSALRIVKLDGIATHNLEVLNIDVGENGCNLSGGEKQRLALGRLFLRHAPLMILDEPTTGLDASTEREIFDGISTYFQDTTLIMVTHREELTRNADQIIRFTPDGIKVEPGKGASRGAVVL